jgi:hypothetical protein
LSTTETVFANVLKALLGLYATPAGPSTAV